MKLEMTKKFQTTKTTTTKMHIYRTQLLLMQATIIKLKKKVTKAKVGLLGGRKFSGGESEDDRV